MKKLLQIVLVSSLSLLCFSCYYDEIEIPSDAPDVVVDPTDPNYVEIFFEADIQPIFTEKCSACHNANRDPDLRVGKSYDALFPNYVTAENADGSKLYTQLNDGHQNLSNTSIKLIQTWINQGAKDN